MPALDYVLTRAALAATASPSPDKTVYLSEAGREGEFVCVAGTAPADPLQGLYVQSSVNPAFYFARIWDRVNGRPEWFGAVTNGPDCLPALQAAILLCPTVFLRNDDYYISATWKINTPTRQVVGQRARSEGRFQGTRIVVRSATADTMQIGPTIGPQVESTRSCETSRFPA